MMRQPDPMADDIACLDLDSIPATLIATTGYHCDVWQITRVPILEHHSAVDVVVKRFREPCSLPEIRILLKEYQMLRRSLGQLIPKARFVATRIGNQDSVIAIAEAVYPWFNIANPANEEETIHLLMQLPRARDQLARFVKAARGWHEEDGNRIIDLYGLDNLVLDRNRDVRYVDSFRVFFHGDIFHLIDGADSALEEKMELSLQRRAYLEYVLSESDPSALRI